MNESKIEIYNREKACIEEERTYGDKFISFLYGSRVGKMVVPVLPTKLISKFYGFLQDRSYSAKKVESFVNEFDIKLSDFITDIDGKFISFNSFFERKLISGKREFVIAGSLPAFAEARYLGFDSISLLEKVPVKGNKLQIKDLVFKEEWIDTFAGGPCLIARLAPVDYHRFHFPDNGKILDSFAVDGRLHSVNPLAITNKNDILQTNERVVTILESENFGKIAYVEVGAMCVGKIVQTYEGSNFRRGEEKGHFLFGGSTVVIVGEKGRWVPTEDILKRSSDHMETLVRLGDIVGCSSL